MVYIDMILFNSKINQMVSAVGVNDLDAGILERCFGVEKQSY